MLEELGQQVAERGIMVYYEDGFLRGEARETLNSWFASRKHTQAFFAEPIRALSSRTERLALCKNMLVQEAIKVSGAASSALATYFVSIDLDCPHRLDRILPGFRAALGAMAHGRYHVLSANSLPVYYDLWSLRSKELLVDYDCFVGDACELSVRSPPDARCSRTNRTALVGWRNRSCSCPAGDREVQNRGACFQYEVRIHPGAEIFDVQAADNGISIYTLAALRSPCKFDGGMHRELVPFQRCVLSLGMRIGIVPSLVSGCGAEHVAAMERESRRKIHGRTAARHFVSVSQTGQVVDSFRGQDEVIGRVAGNASAAPPELKWTRPRSAGRRLSVERIAARAGIDDAASTLLAAIGVISHVAKSNQVRRQTVRETWLRPTHGSLAIRFVLRCGGLAIDHPVRDEARRYDDILCLDVAATELRLRGAILALVGWLRHALVHFGQAKFIVKADDDVYLHLPDIRQHLGSIPAEAAAHALVGYIGLIRLRVSAAGVYHWPGWSVPRSKGAYSWAIGTARGQNGGRDREQRYAEACAKARSCAGPFPLACGPFIALGRGAVEAFLAAPGLRAELESLPVKQKMFPEDWWLGSAFWRLVGASAPLQLFSLARVWGRVYVDTDGFRIPNDVAIFHNRRKFVNRLRLLHAYAVADHCTPSLRWTQTDADCCFAADNISRARHGGNANPWPMHQAKSKGCDAPPLDLRNSTVQRLLGIHAAVAGWDIREKARRRR